MNAHIPHYIVWSTNSVDLDDPFQRHWHLRQVLMHGRAQDIRALDLNEISRLLPDMDLPSHLNRSWQTHLAERPGE